MKLRHCLVRLMIAAALSYCLGGQSARALTVFDPSNYAQNLLQAARALVQIDNQVQSLQHEVTMLQNMARDLAPQPHSVLPELALALRRIEALIDDAEGIALSMAETERAWAEVYPQAYADSISGNALLRDAHQRWIYAMEGFAHSLRLQAELAQTLAGDEALIAELVDLSQAAAGNLQASQATNQLLALQAKQQAQFQAMAAAQYRAQSLEQARQAMAQEQARAQFARFIARRPARP